MNTAQRRRQIEAALPKATPDEQRRMLAELDTLRATERTAHANSTATDLMVSAANEAAIPVMAHTMHTAGTDWLSTIATEEPEDEEVEEELTAEARRWWGNLHEAVKADVEEFYEQARGQAFSRTASMGSKRPAGQGAFLREATRLHHAAYPSLRQELRATAAGDPDLYNPAPRSASPDETLLNPSIAPQPTYVEDTETMTDDGTFDDAPGSDAAGVAGTPTPGQEVADYPQPTIIEPDVEGHVSSRKTANQNWATGEVSMTFIWNEESVCHQLGSVETVADLQELVQPLMDSSPYWDSDDDDDVDWESLLGEVMEDEYVGRGGEGRTASRKTASGEYSAPGWPGLRGPNGQRIQVSGNEYGGYLAFLVDADYNEIGEPAAADRPEDAIGALLGVDPSQVSYAPVVIPWGNAPMPQEWDDVPGADFHASLQDRTAALIKRKAGVTLDMLPTQPWKQWEGLGVTAALAAELTLTDAGHPNPKVVLAADDGKLIPEVGESNPQSLYSDSGLPEADLEHSDKSVFDEPVFEPARPAGPQDAGRVETEVRATKRSFNQAAFNGWMDQVDSLIQRTAGVSAADLDANYVDLFTARTAAKQAAYRALKNEGFPFEAVRRTSSASKCDRCGDDADSEDLYDDDLGKICGECANIVDKQREGSRRKVAWTETTEMISAYPGLTESMLVYTMEANGYTLQIIAGPHLLTLAGSGRFLWGVYNNGETVANGSGETLEDAKAAAEAAVPALSAGTTNMEDAGQQSLFAAANMLRSKVAAIRNPKGLSAQAKKRIEAGLAQIATSRDLQVGTRVTDPATKVAYTVAERFRMATVFTSADGSHTVTVRHA